MEHYWRAFNVFKEGHSLLQFLPSQLESRVCVTWSNVVLSLTGIVICIVNCAQVQIQQTQQNQ